MLKALKQRFFETPTFLPLTIFKYLNLMPIDINLPESCSFCLFTKISQSLSLPVNTSVSVAVSPCVG